MLSNRKIATFVVAVACACASPEAPKAAPIVKPVLPNMRNPSGDCATPADNGARPWHGSSGSRYLPDCNAPLRREYYRVYATSENTAYMMPRPDHGAPVKELCASEQGSPTRALLDAYTLCAEVADVERINAMKPADALAIAHALHARMRFVATGAGVQPFPYEDDVLAVCDARPDLAKGVLAERCRYERDLARRAAQGPIGEPYRVPPDAEGPPLAAALNELYGIAPR